MGGKTGTTNFNSDAWYMGFTPQLVAGAWVGGEERFIHFNTGANGQGSAAALPIYGRFMKKVFNDPTLPYSQDVKFEFPANINLCEDQFGGAEDTATEAENENVEETTMDDIFE